MLLGSVSSFADLIQDKDGDLYQVNIETGKVKSVVTTSRYAPYSIISTNLIKDADGDIYRVDSKTGKVYMLKLKSRYAPYKSIK